MWGGDYMVDNNYLIQELSEDFLLGMSTYTDREYIENNSDSSWQDVGNYRNNTEFIIKNIVSWKMMNVWGKALDFFDYENTESVMYEGFLVNHTKKRAIDLAAYYKKSLSLTTKGDFYAIDPIPALTETGGGLGMALFDGMASATTEKLNMEWCGDLLQIVNDKPDGYKRINCCFADIENRTRFCYKEYGVDKEGFLLEKKGKRFVCCKMDLSDERGHDSFVKVKILNDAVDFSTIPTDSFTLVK
jgi:hypothetical protein